VRLLFDLNIPLLENELLAYNPLPDVLYVVDDSLKVRCSIVGAGNEDLVGLTGRRWGVQRGHGDESGDRS
jgi:hypothetical protein